MLGFLEDSEYEDINIKLELNDEIAIFTDGVVEAKNDNGEQFGHVRIQEVFQNYEGNSFLTALKERLLQFTNMRLDDDTTALWIKRIS